MNRFGYTLMEVMVVVIVIGIMVTIAIPAYVNNMEQARSREAIHTLMSISEAEERCRIHNGAYTAALDDLDVALPASLKFFNNAVISNVSGTGNTAVFSATMQRNGQTYGGKFKTLKPTGYKITVTGTNGNAAWTTDLNDPVEKYVLP